ncbi:NAD(P)H-binding protein [Streptomyces sp. NPDC051940]|uniref:NAD(P)H-binding protein n=1 Tax=Streptomyces sp. NPDC051940 TaxID=3155675 RepID=UPI0034211E75
MRVLVTAATGTVGRQAVAQLLDAGAQVRALVRKPEAAGLPAGVEVVRGDLTDPVSVEEALPGVDGVFLIWPLLTPGPAAEVVAAIGRHARRIVQLSAWGVPDDGSRPEGDILGTHAGVERLVRTSGLEWTVLRAGGFATNTLGWAPQVSAGDTVYAPYAGATRSLIHEADIAAVATRILTAGGHAEAVYHLTGPQALTQAAQVDAIGEALGRPVRMVEIPAEEALAQYTAHGLPEEVARAILAAHARMVDEPETVSPAVEQITGRPARTYLQWARDHAADFGG